MKVLKVFKTKISRFKNVWLASSDKGLVALSWSPKGFDRSINRLQKNEDVLIENGQKKDFQMIMDELENYFSNQETQFFSSFDLSTLPEFSQKVLRLTHRIPWGSVVTYGDLARKAGNPKAARAVGQVMNLNPLPLLIPCHRVIASQNTLGGFALPLKHKIRFLEMEGVAVSGNKILN